MSAPDHDDDGLTWDENSRHLPPCPKCGLVAAHLERVCEEVQALRGIRVNAAELPPCVKCGLMAAHTGRVCEEVQALRAHVLLEPPSNATREIAAEAIGLLAMWMLRAVSALAQAGIMGDDHVKRAMARLRAASAALHNLGELSPGEDTNSAFERLQDRAMRKAQIVTGQGLPNFAKRGRG